MGSGLGLVLRCNINIREYTCVAGEAMRSAVGGGDGRVESVGCKERFQLRCYIRLTGFNEKTDGELGEAMKELNASSLDGLILDMPGNPGGLLDEAIAVADTLVDKNQLIVSHRVRASTERRYYAVRGNRGNNMPLVILLNNNSASATEIVAGAVQDHDRGIIVGETTFGKGLVMDAESLVRGQRFQEL